MQTDSGHRSRSHCIIDQTKHRERSYSIIKPMLRAHSEFKKIRNNRNTVDYLETLHSNDIIWESFKKFSIEELSDENVHLYHEIKEYEKSTVLVRKKMATKIYQQYLNDNSESWANIPKQEATFVKIILDKQIVPSSDLFDLVLKQTKQNLADTYSRYILSTHFQDVNKEINVNKN
eukprot:gene7097-11260_t